MSDFSSEFGRVLRAAGVVGAGGAGFPAYIKAQSRADCVIVNAAECEPLLKKDQKLLEYFPEKVFDGLELMMLSTGAREGVVGIKKKHEKTILRLEEIARARKNIRVVKLGDYYPAGDEQCLVYEVTGRVVPPGGLPLEAGCVVNNVETLYNAALARNCPVTEKWVTITGAVKKPCTIKVPVGISYAEAVEIAGGAKIKEPVAAIDGGPMMGKVLLDLNVPITKASGGLIVLPRSHPLIAKKAQSRSVFSRIGRSVCDQCSFCTELCPRYLLGHNVQPHRVMRNLLFSGPERKLHSQYSLLCCECSLCSLYSCPEGLHPSAACVSAKADLREQKINIKNSSLGSPRGDAVHPLRDFRKVPVSKLIKRLGLAEYNVDAPWLDTDYKPAGVKILMTQHIGVPCVPAVKPGEIVQKGAVVGCVPEDKLGCPVHASISGTVAKVNEKYVEIVR
ncbi:MAG: SLBB domain-containing protein [Elusimicrobia bacterium]|nr:SLBB domain-containing protein [Elusimicrobiota bacterium]